MQPELKKAQPGPKVCPIADYGEFAECGRSAGLLIVSTISIGKSPKPQNSFSPPPSNIE
jgi:hypothetical protein